MSKRNTVQINMEVFDNWLKETGYKSPKEFCERELGLSDGWYYGVRKANGKGVKTLLAQLIANKMGINIEDLLYLEEPEAETPPAIAVLEEAVEQFKAALDNMLFTIKANYPSE